jgi:hypothetical protein
VVNSRLARNGRSARGVRYLQAPAELDRQDERPALLARKRYLIAAAREQFLVGWAQARTLRRQPYAEDPMCRSERYVRFWLAFTARSVSVGLYWPRVQRYGKQVDARAVRSARASRRAQAQRRTDHERRAAKAQTRSRAVRSRGCLPERSCPR